MTEREHTLGFSFPKSEKLCGKADIARLMEHGRRGGAGCLRYCCLVSPLAAADPASPVEDVPAKEVPVSVSDEVRIVVAQYFRALVISGSNRFPQIIGRLVHQVIRKLTAAVRCIDRCK